MKNVAVIANGLWDNARSGEYLPAGEASVQPSAGVSELVPAINELFKELRSIRSAWRQAWPDKEIYQASKRQWYQAFVEAGVCTRGQIEFGMAQVRKQPGDFIPSPGQFVQWCKPTPELLGIPSHDQAYAEAIGNAHPSMVSSREWSHQTVYHAAAHCGFRPLSTMPAEASRKMFDRAYDITIRMLLAGETLRSIPLALPRPAPSRGSEKVANEALALLRKNLGGRGRG